MGASLCARSRESEVTVAGLNGGRVVAQRGMTRKNMPRIERFRRRNNISIPTWASEAGIVRSQLARYCDGTDEPLVRNLLRLVHAARRLTGRQVRAFELYDLGESEPLSMDILVPSYRGRTGNRRIIFDSRFDRYLLLRNIQPAVLSRVSGIPRQTLLRKRAERASMRPRMIARIVSALRRMGHDARASFIVDVGDD